MNFPEDYPQIYPEDNFFEDFPQGFPDDYPRGDGLRIYSLFVQNAINNHPDRLIMPRVLEFTRYALGGRYRLIFPTEPPLPITLKLLNLKSNNIGVLPSFLPPSLETLILDDNPITELPNLPPTLKVLSCNNNRLSRLPILPAGLKTLRISGNHRLEVLPDLPESLEILKCSFNKLQSLPALPNNLKVLVCEHNNLVELPKLPNNLVILDCQNNLIKKIPILPASLRIVSFQLVVLIKAHQDILKYAENEVSRRTESYFTQSFYPWYLNDPIKVQQFELFTEIVREKIKEYYEMTQRGKNITSFVTALGKPQEHTEEVTPANWYYGSNVKHNLKSLPNNLKGFVSKYLSGKEGTLKQQLIQTREKQTRPFGAYGVGSSRKTRKAHRNRKSRKTRRT